MASRPVLSHSPHSEKGSYATVPAASPPATPAALYPPAVPYHQPSSTGRRPMNSWTPLTLQWWVALLAILVLFIAVIGLEVAYAMAKKNKGWAYGAITTNTDVLHYAYTIPPSVVAMGISIIWHTMEREIVKMQPYIELSRGDAPGDKSVLLDYEDQPRYFVIFSAIEKKHYTAALSIFITILMLTVQPLASAVFVVRDTEFVWPAVYASRISVGLDPAFQTITPFVTAAGYAEASILYDLPAPPFTMEHWTIGQITLPPEILNVTVVADTIGFESHSGCEVGDTVNLTRDSTADGYQLTGTWSGCTATLEIDTIATTQYGVNAVTSCDSDLRDLPIPTKPVMFWIFSATADFSVANASVAFCQPTLRMYNVRATVAAPAGILLDVQVLSDYVEANNVTTGAPLNGHAFNGIEFDIPSGDRYLLARQNATQSGLPSAIYQAATKRPGGLNGMFANSTAYLDLTDSVYQLFLTLVAKQVYFLSAAEGNLPVEVRRIEPRLWLSAPATHTLAAIFLVSAVFGTILHIRHYMMRRALHMAVDPGTIAGVVSLTAKGNLGDELDAGMTGQEIQQRLMSRRFGMDAAGRVVIEKS